MGPRAIYHLFVFIWYVYVCYFDFNLVKGKLLPIHDQFFSKFVWLTIIDLYLQTFYNFVAFVISISGGRHTIFHFVARTLVGPIGMTVVVLFWALFLFDPNTLLADDIAKQILSIQWYNHSIHTIPLVTVVIDLFLWNHGQPAFKTAFKTILCFTVLYVIDLHYVHYISGFWAYPILGDLPIPLRSLFIVACVAVFLVNYWVLSGVHRVAHGSNSVVDKKTR